MKKENKPTEVSMKFNKISSQTLKFQYIMTVQLLIGILYVFLERLYCFRKVIFGSLLVSMNELMLEHVALVV